MRAFSKKIISVLLLLITFSLAFNLLFQPFETRKEISLSQLVNDINQEKVEKITISGNGLSLLYRDGTGATSRKEEELGLSQSLMNYGVSPEKLRKLDVETKEAGGVLVWLVPILSFLLPLLLFAFFFWTLLKQARTGVTQAFDFTKARARLFGAGGHPEERITFKDVAALKEAKEELKEIVDFLKNPKKYLQMGARIPRGVLLMGPAGVGKTLLARAVAGEANVPFFSISGSEFVEMFVGVGASRVRDLFATAKRAGRSIVFIDELDAVGRARGAGIGGGHDEREQTLNQILVEMDGFERDDTRIVIAATNRPDILDSALLRPGRFDRKVVLDLPDIKGREDILKIHARDKPLALKMNLREVAERTPGFSGADLANLMNEAALLAARKNKRQIFQEEVLESIEKVLLGPERKSHILSKREKEFAAYHEAGHALVSSSLPESEPVRKISIVARGSAAGYTLKVPREDRKIKTKSEFLAEMTVLLAGFSAEKLRFGQITTGAANDLRRATGLARKLVKEYGMSSLGPVAFGKKDELVFLGKEISEQRTYSEKVAAQIDKEVAKFIKTAQGAAKKILTKKRKLLDKIAKTLIEKETIEREEFENLMGKKELKKTKVLLKKEKSIRVKVKRL